MHWHRLALVAGLVTILVWGAWQLREHGPGGVPFLPGCHFRRWTGLDCPGCGMTRATAASLNGRFLEAFALNPLGMILLPLALVGLLPETYNWVSKKPIRWQLRPGIKTTRLIVISIFVFWFVRNLPWWPLRAGME
ncbi:uncharacterized protein DUF2752 [Prosthecobacter fusiformis]|uniref:Uncharacterized protein DUF2752 n=1 Tax=Prosthecobacter fusiformis TaxID=48464 RepID=A0A4R7SSN5_9BACT|nr:DUF2752 domain-containing protein [Prosthecobacter fusiformis]TDU81208.1 uncharacterized protein DUF2752 [Prosthecobacter fusiformis]